MSEHFFECPILNSPYEYPGQHWELDNDGQPTNRIIGTRRRSDLITPVPKPRKRDKQLITLMFKHHPHGTRAHFR